jgi:hypothetical protein
LAIERFSAAANVAKIHAYLGRPLPAEHQLTEGIAVGLSHDFTSFVGNVG